MTKAIRYLLNATERLPGLERLAESQPMRNLLLSSIDGVRMELLRARLALEQSEGLENASR